MRLRPGKRFAWREITCESEQAAKAEAERQQASDDDDQAEWISLRHGKTGNWLALRRPRHLEVERHPVREGLLDLLNPFGW